MATKKPPWAAFSLRNEQRDALAMCVRYIDESDPSAQGGAALVCMPTGTGKTAVIATLSHCLPQCGDVLVLTPWLALRDQLESDLQDKTWRAIGATRPDKTILSLLPSNADECAKKTSNLGVVFVATMQTWQALHRQSHGSASPYSRLRKRLSLVLVDEGHREPATKWSASVRALKKPTLLFTATPYRNDIKRFDIRATFIFTLTHATAIQKERIRKLDFREVTAARPDTYIDALVEAYEDVKKRSYPGVKTPRVIVRCDSFDEVGEIADELERRKMSYVAVHERYKGATGPRRAEVPTHFEEAQVWVHQNKLIEGIDDTSFVLLGLYRPFGNSRALVQQIGRILRTKDGTTSPAAIAMARASDRQKSQWLAYEKYSAARAQAPVPKPASKIFDQYLEANENIEYADGSFRERLSFSADLHKHLRYPVSTNVFVPAADFDAKDLASAMSLALEEADADLRPNTPTRPDANTFVQTYVMYGNCETLLTQAMLQYRVGYTFFRLSGKYLFYIDSEGIWPEYLHKHAVLVDPRSLERLFPKASTRRLSNVSLLNTDLGRASLRQRSLRAHSLGDAAPDLVDHLHVCSTMHGFVDRKSAGTLSRYVGFTRGRVSEVAPKGLDFGRYVAWLDGLAVELASSRPSVQTLKRFAPYTRAPANKTQSEPTNILLDFPDELVKSLAVNEGLDETSEAASFFDDVCCDVSSWSFTCSDVNGIKYPVKIQYEHGRYMLESAELEALRLPAGYAVRAENLIAHLNRTQSFRIVPKMPGVIYAHGRFYEPRLPLWGKDDRLELLNVLYPEKLLASLGEKGADGSAKGLGWAPDSLFGLVDARGRGTQDLKVDLGRYDVLICDDIGHETADFIGVSLKQPRVVYIHAKAPPKLAPLSASKLHEVQAQAVKNLAYIQAQSPLDKAIARRWDRVWKGGRVGRVDRRIRWNKAWTADDAMERILEIVRDPNAQREVWVLLGRCLSKSSLQTARTQAQPEPQLVQIFYLLQSLWSQVSAVGAQLKVFCSP